MTIANIEHQPAVLKRVAALRDQIAAVQEELQTILRGAGSMRVAIPHLHDETNGRIDAQKIAAEMGIPLKTLCEGLKINYKAVHRNPSAAAFQPQLKQLKRILDILHEFFHKSKTVRVWLNTPHPDLDGDTALDAILAHNVRAVLRVLENAAAGVPV